MKTIHHRILLADDDRDDCLVFKDALEELQVSELIETVHDGAELMVYLSHHTSSLPNVLFLDLNMPRKTGIECLMAIKQHDSLKNIPVIIYSTSLNEDVVKLLYEMGALHYIQKPAEFGQVKKVIREALTSLTREDSTRPSIHNFVIQP